PSWNALLIDEVVFGFGRNKGPVLTMPSPFVTWCVGPVTFAARSTTVTLEAKNDGSILAKDVQLSGMPACIRGRSAGQTVGSGLDNTIHWNTAVYSGGGATTPNTDNIRVPRSLLRLLHDLLGQRGKRHAEQQHSGCGR